MPQSTAPSREPEHRRPEGDDVPPRLPGGTIALVAALLLIPCVALAAVPTYSRETPRLGGWPFFYWYQMLWVVLTPALAYLAFRLIERARRGR